jgi:hypothetical protein
MRPLYSSGTTVVSEQAAIDEAMRSCNVWPNASTIGVGLVTAGSEGALWAVFVNPPGTHFLADGAGTGGVTANWFVVLINAQGHEPHQWSCAAGHSLRLPMLPIHK